MRDLLGLQIIVSLKTYFITEIRANEVEMTENLEVGRKARSAAADDAPEANLDCDGCLDESEDLAGEKKN